MKKKRLIFLFALVVLVTGCNNTQESKVTNNREYAVIKSSMKYGDKTEITYFDKQLNQVGIQKYEYGNVGEFQYLYPVVKNEILYEISLGYGYDKDNCKIIAINLKTDQIKEYKLDRVNITSFYVDDKYIYAISNLNRVTYIDRYVIGGDDMQSIILENTISVDMFVCNEKVYFYTEQNGKSILNRTDFFTKHTEKVLSDKINFEDGTNFNVIYNNRIYVPYGKDIVAISPDTLKFEVIKMPESGNAVSGLYQDGHNLYVAQADTHGENSKLCMIQYDLKEQKIVNEYKTFSTLMQFSVKKDELYVLSFEDELIKFHMKNDGQLKELKRKQLKTTGYQFVSAGFICNN